MLLVHVRTRIHLEEIRAKLLVGRQVKPLEQVVVMNRVFKHILYVRS